MKKPEDYQCIDYFRSHGSDKDEGLKFFYYYESKGWIVGRTPMKSWQAAAGGWISRNKKPDAENVTVKAKGSVPFSKDPEGDAQIQKAYAQLKKDAPEKRADSKLSLGQRLKNNMGWN